MAIRATGKNRYTVQVQHQGERKTRRITGTAADAKKAEAELLGEMQREAKLDAAAALLGVERSESRDAPIGPAPTLNAFFNRWGEHAKVVQNERTRRAQLAPFRYLLFYLGDRPLIEIVRPSAVNEFVEKMKEAGPLSFSVRQDGQPRRRAVEEFTNETINKCLCCLRAVLNLAHAEGVIPTEPKINLLPTDDSTPVLPPTEDEYQALLSSCDDYAARAPLMRELVEFTAETGLRRGEVFNLHWTSVDLARGAIRIEAQSKTRMVNGKAWKPKHNKWREVPLSARAKAVVDQLLAGRAHKPGGLLFPNVGGAPYERVDGAPRGAGHGWFPEAVQSAGLKGRVTFHGLRHLFAVRLLTKGVAITIVSELLGHSDINLTVKRYGRFASDAKVKFDAIRVLDAPSALASPLSPAPERKLVALDGGRNASDAGRPVAPARTHGAPDHGAPSGRR